MISAIGWAVIAAFDHFKNPALIHVGIGGLIVVLFVFGSDIVSAVRSRTRPVTEPHQSVEVPSPITTTVESLQQQIQALRQRSLTVAQREKLATACRLSQEQGPAIHFGILYNCWNHEAENYARDLAQVFSQAGMSEATPGANRDRNVPDELEGLIIRIGSNPYAAHRDAYRLGQILSEANIRWKMMPMRKHRLVPYFYFELIVGRAPLDGGPNTNSN